MPIYSLGSNAINQLGLGEDEDCTHIPKEIKLLKDEKIIKVRCGSIHTLALSSQGTLYSWGCNDEGALGREGDESTPSQINKLENIVDIGCGASISAALTKDGRVYIWGKFRSTSGGYGLTISRKLSRKPIRLSLKNIKKIVVGQNFVAALDKKGIIYTLGSNEFGQLGRRTSERNKLRSLIPDSVNKLTNKKINHKFIDIGCGLNHVLAINSDNEVYGWGSNLYGQLGINDVEQSIEKFKIPIKNVVQVTGGENHSIFLTKDGCLFTCGRNKDSQLGVKNVKDTYEMQKVDISNVSEVRCHNSFAYCKINNDLYSWGTGFNGSLGVEDETVEIPTKIDFDFKNIVDFDVGNDFAVISTREK